MIQPILLTTFKGNTPLKSNIQNPQDKDYFSNSARNLLSMEDEIEQLQQDIEAQERKHKALEQMLNNSYGKDWIFCYDDLSNAQSDMYIQCIRTRAIITKEKAKAKELTEKYTALKHQLEEGA
ncbi:MAG: hypothetical protein IJ877_01480 [Candidatus Gastranaerophilales bacterium]|nr:hypothetical protein [Candidatus Gastranaerophilales bacterium]